MVELELADVRDRLPHGWSVVSGEVHYVHTHLALLAAARECLEVLVVGARLVHKLVQHSRAVGAALSRLDEVALCMHDGRSRAVVGVGWPDVGGGWVSHSDHA